MPPAGRRERAAYGRRTAPSCRWSSTTRPVSARRCRPAPNCCRRPGVSSASTSRSRLSPTAEIGTVILAAQGTWHAGLLPADGLTAQSAVPLPVRPGGAERQQLRRHQEPGVRSGGQGGLGDRGNGRLPGLGGGGEGAVQHAGPGAVRRLDGARRSARASVRTQPGRCRPRPRSGCSARRPWRSQPCRSARPCTLATWHTHPWVRFAVRRGVRLLVSLLALVTAAFLMIHLIPGDPVRARSGRPHRRVWWRRGASRSGSTIRSGCSTCTTFGTLFTGDLGTSITSGLPVSDVIGDRLPATVQLAVAAFVVAVLIAVPSGLVMGVLTRGGRRPRAELAFTSTSVVLAAIPEFLLAVGLVYVFAVKLGWFPVAGPQHVSVVRAARAVAGRRPGRGARPDLPGRDCSRAADRLRAHRPRQAAASGRYLSPARAAQRADGDAHPRRSAARRDGRRHRAGRERLRLARTRQHDRLARSWPRTTRSCRASSSSTASACCW